MPFYPLTLFNIKIMRKSLKKYLLGEYDNLEKVISLKHRPIIIIDHFNKLVDYNYKDAVNIVMTAKELHEKYAFIFVGSEGLNITLKLLGNGRAKILEYPRSTKK